VTVRCARTSLLALALSVTWTGLASSQPAPQKPADAPPKAAAGGTAPDATAAPPDPNAPPAPTPGKPEPPKPEPPDTGLLPKTVEPRPASKTRFVADPISDGAVLTFAIGFGALSELIIGTEELTPQQPTSKDRLLSIDRPAVNAKPNKFGATVSNYGLFGAVAFAVIDPVLTGFRDSSSAGLVDFWIYAETVSITWASTNLAKIAVRRPRPSAYQQQELLTKQYEGTGKDPPSITDTNSALSFYSGHAAIVASVASTATYLAFARGKGKARPWITLGVGVTATGVTMWGRMASGKHFPTDVLAGAMAGTGIGLLVPHIHREEAAKQRPVWIGLAPAPGATAGLSVIGGF
jgi:membrane-associated phospholipid phosphatase